MKIRHRKVRALNPAFDPGDLGACRDSNPWGSQMPKMTGADWKRLEAQNSLRSVASTLSGHDGRIEVTAQHARAALSHLDAIEKKLGNTKSPDQREKIKHLRGKAQLIIQRSGTKKTGARRHPARRNTSESASGTIHVLSESTIATAFEITSVLMEQLARLNLIPDNEGDFSSQRGPYGAVSKAALATLGSAIGEDAARIVYEEAINNGEHDVGSLRATYASTRKAKDRIGNLARRLANGGGR